jgi:hypothetical protein
MTTQTDADRGLDDEYGHAHEHEDERAIPTLLKVAVLVAVALGSVWVGWMLR